MEEYFELKERIKKIEDEMQGKVKQILQKYGYDENSAYFIFRSPNGVVLLWDEESLPMNVLEEFIKDFGKVKRVYTTPLSRTMNIVFERMIK